MNKKAPTIYDVAQKAGVSPATVSRVLNEPSRVNNEKRQGVLTAIEELNFIPKAAAVANARKTYKKIGVIAPFFTQPSFMQRLRGISAVLSEDHYELVIYAIESCEELNAYIDMLVSNYRVDGLIVLCLKLTNKSTQKLRKSKIPVCFVEIEMEGFDSVVVKNTEGGMMAARYFYESGYRNPGFLGEQSMRPYAVPATELRLEGYTKYLVEKGITINRDNIWIGPFTEENLDAGIESLLEHENRPDCIFTSSDLSAIRLIKKAKEYNIAIPEDLAVIGFDNLDITEFTSLTTVCQNLDESGRIAAELVLARIKDKERSIRTITIQLSIKKRDTVGIKT